MTKTLLRYFKERKRRLTRWFIILMVTVPTRRKIAKYLKTKRLKAGLSIEEAAQRSGIPLLVIQYTERAWYSIPLCYMTSLIEVYGADKFQYVDFMNRLGFVIHKRMKTMERTCGLARPIQRP